ncbi:MAG TPA: DUF1592 domain-containing protein [Humisphaera sp.]
MNRTISLLAVLAAPALLWPTAARSAEEARLPDKHRAFLQRYCVECHNEQKQKGKLRLDDVSFALDSVERADRWQKVLNQVNAGEMPPEDAKQPSAVEKADFLEGLSRTLMAARRSLADVRGKVTMRRLNRREYRNTIRDLLGVEVDARDLPADGGAGTFDTVGSNLFMSGDQFEAYLALGRRAIDEHLARAVPSSPSRTLHVEVEAQTTPRVAKALKDREDARDRYLRWTAAVDAAAARPQNAEAAKAVRAEKAGDATHVYSQWQRLAGAPSPADFGFTDAVHADEQGRRDWVHYVPHHKAYVQHPATKTGSFLTIDDVYVNPFEAFRIPRDWPVGDYVVRVRLAATDAAPKERRFVEFGSRFASGAFAVASAHQVTGTMADPQVLEIPLKLTGDSDRSFFLRERGSKDSDQSANRIFAEALRRNGVGPELAIWVDWIEVEAAGAARAAGGGRTIRERREVELHANAMVGGTYNGYFKGGYTVAKAYLDSDRSKPPSAFGKGIPDEIEAKFRVKVFEQHGPSFERYLNDPLTKTGSLLTIYNVHPEEVITLPPDQPSGWLKTKHEVESAAPGEYVLRFRIGAVKGTPTARHFVALGSRKEKDDFTLLRTFQVTGTTDEPQVIEIPVSVTAEGPRTYVLRERRDVKLDHDLYEAARKETGVGPPSALWLDWVEWEGPLAGQSTAPAVPSKRYETEAKAAEMKRTLANMAANHDRYQQWKAAGGKSEDLGRFGFQTDYQAEFRELVWQGNHEWYERYLARPEAATGLLLDNTLNETCEYVVDLPQGQPTGDYVFRVNVGKVPDMPADRAFLSFVQASPIDKDDRTLLTSRQVTADLAHPQVIELPFRVEPGGPRKFIFMERRPLKKEAISLGGRTKALKDPKQRDPVLWIDWVELSGPLPAAGSRPAVEPVLPPDGSTAGGAGERDRARAVLERFAVRAFRDRRPSAAYLDKLVKLFDTRRAAGDTFDVAIREPLSVVLASPGFLYLAEPGEEGKPRRLTDVELATRLSYFLWSAPPDEPLLSLARRGELHDPAVLAREVDRMIVDRRSDAFVSGFVHQWLGMERLDFFQFDTKQFRDFDESTKAAARREVYETFAHLLRADRSAARLLKSDEVYVNGLLATYYGIDGVTGDEFRPVPVPPGSPRGGLLGMAAVLAMGSNGERTSPVERGAWVLRKLLHDPPPDAPPNVPQLTRLEAKLLTTRERLLAHQEQPQCAQCHRKIDPIGFGLENFDAAGKWRTEETYERRGVGKKTWAIDPAGAFYKGPAFKDYFELRDLVAARRDDFARGLTEALIEYALGRPYGFTDEPLADDVLRRAKGRDLGLREFVHGIVASDAFQTK